MGVRHDDAQTLDPLFGVLPVFRFQDQRLVPGEDLERFWNVSRPSRHLHRPDLVDVYRLAAALKQPHQENNEMRVGVTYRALARQVGTREGEVSRPPPPEKAPASFLFLELALDDRLSVS
jgi:hypothetical protein